MLPALLLAGSVLQVRVVDAEGAPAPNVRVDVHSVLYGGVVAPGSAVTDASGIARLEDAERWYTPEARAQIPAVFVALPLVEADWFPLLHERVPDAPIELKLPPTASLRVRVFDFDGRAYDSVQHDDPMHVRLSWHDRYLTETRVCDARWERDAPGWAVFDRVGLGNVLDLKLSTGTGRVDPLFAPFTRPGESIELVLALGPPVARVHGRLVDPDGKPLVGVRVAYGRGAPPEGDEQLGAKFDAEDPDGCFEIALDRVLEDGTPGRGSNVARLGAFAVVDEATLWFRVVQRGPDLYGTAGPLATAIVRRLGAEDEVQLGDVRFDAWDRLYASGFVRDPLDRPIADARIVMMQRVETVGRENGKRFVLWRTLDERRSGSGADGRFELRSPLALDADVEHAIAKARDRSRDRLCNSDTFLFVQAGPWLPAFVPIDLREPLRDAAIVLARAYELEARVELDAGVDPASIEVELGYREWTPLLDWIENYWPPEYGSAGVRAVPLDCLVRWRRLPAGTVDVRVSKTGSSTPLVAFEGFAVPERLDELKDALARVDLRGKVR